MNVCNNTILFIIKIWIWRVLETQDRASYSPSGRWGSPAKELMCKLVCMGGLPGGEGWQGSSKHMAGDGGSENMLPWRKSSRTIKLDSKGHGEGMRICGKTAVGLDYLWDTGVQGLLKHFLANLDSQVPCSDIVICFVDVSESQAGSARHWGRL